MPQSQPSDGFEKRLLSIRGATIPPIEPPALAIPVANPRRSRKKWPTEARHGVNKREQPVPLSTPNTRMKCQYSANC